MLVINVTKMEASKNGTFNSMVPLVRILKVFCLNVNIDVVKLNSTAILTRSIITLIIIGCLNVAGLYFKLHSNDVYRSMDLSIKITDIVQIVADFCQYSVDLYFVYKYGRHISVEYFKQYNCVDSILNVSCLSTMKSKLLKLMVFFIIIWGLSSLLDFGAWVTTYGWITPLCHSVTYLFLFIKMLTTLDLIAHIIHIEVRLRIVGDFMHGCYLQVDTWRGSSFSDCVSNKRWLYSNDGTVSHVLNVKRNDGQEIRSLTSCYLLLTEQVSFINKIYGFRILLNCLSLLTDMIKITNLSVRMVLGTQKTMYNSSYFPIMSSVFRLLTCAAIFITVVGQCESAYRQRERIVNIMDHLLVNKSPGDDLRNAVTSFRVLIQERPVVFNMANFFNLNNSLLVSLASVVVTYSIILLQSVD